MAVRRPPSLFFNVLMQYRVDSNGQLVDKVGHNTSLGHYIYAGLRGPNLGKKESKEVRLDDKIFTSQEIVLSPSARRAGLDIALFCELLLEASQQTLGILSIRHRTPSQRLDDNSRQDIRTQLSPNSALDFDEYISLLILSYQSKTPFTYHIHDASPSLMEVVTHLFENTLLSIAPEGDKWNEEGRAHFTQQVGYFLRRLLPIRFCLPAFPCKSSNPRKTASRLPDGAELEALSTLHKFCADVQELYSVGCTLTILSDGHVFSDCVGTADEQVYKYTAAMRSMSDFIFQSRLLDAQRGDRRDSGYGSFSHANDNANPISFLNLHDIFHAPDCHSVCPSHLVQYQVNHPLSTETLPADEWCRKLIMQSCHASRRHLQHIIKTRQGSNITAIYRGFSRFMLEDLAAQPDMTTTSRRHQRRLSSRVALEMLQRNQAYSHLAELLMPHYIRLSIHAHKNNGPKFAINLLSKSKFRTLHDFNKIHLAEHGDKEIELSGLHIPTPWHNVLVQIEGRQYTYICKAGLVQDELKNPHRIYIGSYVPLSLDLKEARKSGRYVLSRRTVPASITKASLSKLAAQQLVDDRQSSYFSSEVIEFREPRYDGGRLRGGELQVGTRSRRSSLSSASTRTTSRSPPADFDSSSSSSSDSSASSDEESSQPNEIFVETTAATSDALHQGLAKVVAQEKALELTVAPRYQAVGHLLRQ